MSIKRAIKKPVPHKLSRAISQPGTGGGGDPGEALLAGARIFVDWSDAANNDRKFARNQNAPVPSGNLLAFPTGWIVNESGGATPARTNFYPTLPDPSGVTNNATRVLSSGANQVVYFVRAGQGPMPPAGTYTLRLRARANTGTGPWACSFGTAAGYTAGSISDLDWTDPGNDAATTLETTFSYNGTSDIALRLTASGSDVLIDRLQLYEGSSAPAWEDEVFGGGRLPYAFTNSLTLTAEGYVDQTGVVSGFEVIDPAFPERHTYSGYTIMQVSSRDSIPSAASHLVNVHFADGGTTSANLIQYDGSSPYQGEVNTQASGDPSRSHQAFNVAGSGVFICGHGRDSATSRRVVWSDTAPAVIESLAFTPQDIARWTVGGWAATNIAGARLNLSPGDYCYTVIWDRLLSYDEFSAAANALRARLVAASVPNLLPIEDFHVLSGDSNWTRGTTDWTQIITGAGYMGAEQNVYAAVTAVGGEGLGNLENGDLNDWTGVINSSGRFLANDAPALVGACKGMDARGAGGVGYWPGMGTNDFPRMIDDVNAYIADYQALVDAALALHPRITVFLANILPKFSPVVDPSSTYDSTLRATVNSAWQAAAAASSGRIVYVDQSDGLVSGDFDTDGIHLIATGNTKVAANNAAAIAAWRAAL